MGMTVTDLSRGGKLIEADQERLQFAAYPETIKDTLAQEVPHRFVLPQRLFDTELGVSAADIEFPIYYHFFLKNQKVTVVCGPEQVDPVRETLREAIFGPRDYSLEREFLEGSATPGFPDLAAECRYFATLDGHQLQLSDLLDLVILEQGQARLGGFAIERGPDDLFRVRRGKERVEFTLEHPPCQGSEPGPDFSPPSFGVTVIGSGHGFDAKTTTAGFLIWLNGKGVLVDPPVHTPRWLREQGVDYRLISDLILTHCHADHDSGTLQMILQETRLRLHTTPTILKSFVAKYSPLMTLGRPEFLRLFQYSPVGIDQPVNIRGGEFRFKYRLHSVPTIGFEVFFRGQSLVYSSDTVYCEETVNRLCREGILSPSRRDDLLAFPWEHSLVLHETGIGPVHTPVASLARLPNEIKRRLYVIHASPSMLAADSGLRLIPTGVEKTVELKVEEKPEDRTLKLLELLAHIDVFRELTVEKAIEFVRLAHYEQYHPGVEILSEGQPGQRFYMVCSGEVEIFQDGDCLARVGRYEYFGEVSALLGTRRTATVVAATEVELVSLSRADFFYFMRGTKLPVLLRRLAENRVLGCWNLLQESPLFGSLTTFQKTNLMSLLELREYPEGTLLFEPGSPAESYYLLEAGELVLVQADGKLEKVARGALLGRIGRNLEACSHQSRAECLSDVLVYQASATDLLRFLATNPGVYISLIETLE